MRDVIKSLITESVCLKYKLPNNLISIPKIHISTRADEML